MRYWFRWIASLAFLLLPSSAFNQATEQGPRPIIHDVPFVRHDRVEVASAFMVAAWVRMEGDVTQKELRSRINRWVSVKGPIGDISLADTQKILNEDLAITSTEIVDFDLEVLTKALSDQSRETIVIVPVNAQIIYTLGENVHYAEPGFPNHIRPVIGHKGGVLFTNDSAIGKGEGHTLSKDALNRAVGDFPTAPPGETKYIPQNRRERRMMLVWR